MKTMDEAIQEYLYFCTNQRRLDEKTIRAYTNDLLQFKAFCQEGSLMVPRKTLESYVIGLHQRYKQKTVKRKIASLKAFYNYLEMEEKIEANPLRRIRMDFREEKVLPRTIPAVQVERLLTFMYSLQNDKDLTPCQRKNVERDLAVVELLFATGLRISELCHLKPDRVDLEQGILCIRGKGSKERYIQIANTAVLHQVKKYRTHWRKEIQVEQFFFLNRYGKRYSEQSARKMIKKYASQAGICLNITPHMFRHTFATLLLEEDVDIRYIQKMLGHSSILTTQIYTEVASRKQMEILKTKHPRNQMRVGW